MYTLFLVDPESGKILNLTGSFWDRKEPLDYQTDFDSLVSAKLVGENILMRNEYYMCSIFNHDTRDEEFICDQEKVDRYLESRREIRAYRGLPWFKRMFVSKPDNEYPHPSD